MGLRAVPPDAEKGLVFNVLKIASNCLNAEIHVMIKIINFSHIDTISSQHEPIAQ